MTTKKEQMPNLSIYLQNEIMKVLKLVDIDKRSDAFNEFYEIFEKNLKESLLFLFKEDNHGKYKNTTISITKEQSKTLRELKRRNIFTSLAEAVRFIFIYGMIEKHKRIIEIKLNKEIKNKEIKKILSKVISIEEYHANKSKSR